MQNVRSTLLAQYGVTRLRTSISCGWRNPNEVLRVPIVPHVSNSQYFLVKVLTGNYCALLTCATMVPVVRRLECGCTKYSQNVLRFTVLRLRTISGGYGSTFFSALLFWREEKVLRKKCPKSAHKYDWQKGCEWLKNNVHFYFSQNIFDEASQYYKNND